MNRDQVNYQVLLLGLEDKERVLRLEKEVRQVLPNFCGVSGETSYLPLQTRSWMGLKLAMLKFNLRKWLGLENPHSLSVIISLPERKDFRQLLLSLGLEKSEAVVELPLKEDLSDAEIAVLVGERVVSFFSEIKAYG